MPRVSAGRETLGDRFEGDADRGRMMREVVDHRHARRLSDHLLPAHDALEGAQSRGNLVAGNPECAQQHVNAERVGDVHSAADRQMDRFMDSIAAARHRKSRAVRAHRDFRRAIFALAQSVGEPPRAARPR